MATRRQFLSLIAAPAIVRAASLMPVVALAPTVRWQWSDGGGFLVPEPFADQIRTIIADVQRGVAERWSARIDRAIMVGDCGLQLTTDDVRAVTDQPEMRERIRRAINAGVLRPHGFDYPQG